MFLYFIAIATYHAEEENPQETEGPVSQAALQPYWRAGSAEDMQLD